MGWLVQSKLAEGRCEGTDGSRLTAGHPSPVPFPLLILPSRNISNIHPISPQIIHYARSHLVLLPPCIHLSPAFTGAVAPFACTFRGMREGHASFTIAIITL